jgi:hypothetical protein
MGMPCRDFRTGRIHGPMTAKVASLQDAAERFERADAPLRANERAFSGHRVSGTTRTV